MLITKNNKGVKFNKDELMKDRKYSNTSWTSVFCPAPAANVDFLNILVPQCKRRKLKVREWAHALG